MSLKTMVDDLRLRGAGVLTVEDLARSIATAPENLRIAIGRDTLLDRHNKRIWVTGPLVPLCAFCGARTAGLYFDLTEDPFWSVLECVCGASTTLGDAIGDLAYGVMGVARPMPPPIGHPLPRRRR